MVGRTQSVLVDGTKSPEEAVLSGVPQGTVLGPLMFLLYINDMPSQVQRDTHCRLFADDSLLYRVIDSTLDQVQLQQDLKNLEKWALDWGMVFNPSKGGGWVSVDRQLFPPFVVSGWLWSCRVWNAAEVGA